MYILHNNVTPIYIELVDNNKEILMSISRVKNLGTVTTRKRV
jgi:hypothetical protein